jgi:putative hemolysin
MPKLPIAGDEEQGILTEPPFLPGLPEFAGKLIPMEQARQLYERVRSAPQGFRLEALLAEMKVELDVQPADIARIPIKGPLVAVANHPFGVLDGVVLTVLLSRVRPDVKILTNSLLRVSPNCTSVASLWTPFTLRVRPIRI